MDQTPDHSNRAAFLIGRVLHPYILPAPTLLLILNDYPLNERVGWMLLIVGIVLLPGMIAAALMRHAGRLLHMRQTRNPLYLIGWGSILICTVILLATNAPRVLVACTAALAIWAPLQWLINRRVTKVSAHAAVATGCVTGLILAGKVESAPLVAALIGLITVIMWARIVTRNHTLVQVILGAIVGGLPVLLIFPIILR